MPIDSSIYAQIQAPKFNAPFERLGEITRLKAERDSAHALAEQRRASTEKTQQETAAKAAAEETAMQVKALFARTDPTTGQPLPPRPDELAGLIGPEDATKIFTGFEALKTATGANQDATRSRIASVLGAIKAFPEPLRAGAYAGARGHLIQDGTLKPEDAPEQYEPSFIDNALRAALKPAEQVALDKAPADYTLGDQRISGATNQPIATASPKAEKAPAVGGFEDYVLRFAADRRLEPAKLSAGQIRAAKAQYDSAGRAPASEGAKFWVVRDGQPVRVSEAEYRPGDSPSNVRERTATGIERQTLAFYNRAKEADTTIEPLEPTIAKMGLVGQGRLQMAPNFAQLQENQSYRQAQRAFTEARLRKESGAAIPPAEYENDSKTYFAQPGDGQKILEQKRKARQTVLDGLAFSSGKAYDEYYGEPRAGTKAPGGGSGAPPPGGGTGGGSVTVKTPDGQSFTFANQAQADVFKKRAGIP